MRTIYALLVVLALAGVASAGTTKATLRIVDTTSITIRGAGFHAEQAVRIAVSQGGRVILRRTARAGSRGGFTAVLAVAPRHRCGGDLAITARDASGRLAAAKLPLPDCPPPLAP